MTRRVDVDLVRAIALVSMYVAHVAPSSRPGDGLVLSEYLTMPLFAMLIGVGAQLGTRRAARAGRARWWRSMLVRAAVLVVIGLALERAGAQVLIVLVHLGALVVVAGLLTLLPTRVVLLVGATAFVATPLLMEHVYEQGALLGTSPWATETETFLWAGYAYRLFTMVVYATIGIALTRWWLGTSRTPLTAPLATGGLALLAAAAILAAGATGRVELAPYSGTHLETLLNALLVTGTLGVVVALGRLLPAIVARSVVAPVVAPVVARSVAAMGAMTLTLYTLHILWLAYDVRVLHPGARDDSWFNLAVLTLGSLAIAVLWNNVVRHGVWRRGPLEGLAATMVGTR